MHVWLTAYVASIFVSTRIEDCIGTYSLEIRSPVPVAFSSLTRYKGTMGTFIYS